MLGRFLVYAVGWPCTGRGHHRVTRRIYGYWLPWGAARRLVDTHRSEQLAAARLREVQPQHLHLFAPPESCKEMTSAQQGFRGVVSQQSGGGFLVSQTKYDPALERLHQRPALGGWISRSRQHSQPALAAMGEQVREVWLPRQARQLVDHQH